MLKISKLVVATVLIALLSSTVRSEVDDGSNVEYKMINHIRYHKTMVNGVNSVELMRIPFGESKEQVGGHDQDKSNSTNGLPMAFRPSDNPDEIWILDSINKSLKLFKSGKLINNIPIKEEMGTITDFAFNKAGKIAFLNQNQGNIYVVNERGDILNIIKGFQYATSIEFASEKNILVVSPFSKGVVKVSDEGAPLGVYEADQTLSNYSSSKGLWGLDCYGGNDAKLFVRNEGVNSLKVVAEFHFKPEEDVEYKGGNIYGFDKEGNIYFGLMACDLNGIVYRDRIYKCNQNGKLLKEIDVIDRPVISPDLPRHRIVCPDGRILTFFADHENYYLYTYDMK